MRGRCDVLEREADIELRTLHLTRSNTQLFFYNKQIVFLRFKSQCLRVQRSVALQIEFPVIIRQNKLEAANTTAI